MRFLEEFAPQVGGYDSASSGGYIADRVEEKIYVQKCRDWQRIKYDNGWAGLTWPKEFGGQGLTGILRGRLQRRRGEARLRHRDFRREHRHGRAHSHRSRHPGAARAFSASDAEGRRLLVPAVLRTGRRAPTSAGCARRLCVTATSGSSTARKSGLQARRTATGAILLTRSDPEAVKHRGITYFLVDMNTLGIEVRPLVQITGVAHFNEVFLTDVRIPHENILGEVHGGWAPIMTTLSHERTLIGGGSSRASMQDLFDLAARFGAADDPLIRQKIVDIGIRTEILKYLGYRSRTAATKGEEPGPESSVTKLSLSLLSHEIGNLVMELCGPYGTLSSDDGTDEGRWVQDFLGQWGVRIGGGTDNIQRNTIGEKVLGLPPEHRVDKGIPFKEIPTG